MAEIDALNKLSSNNLLDIITPKDNKLLRFFNQMLLYNYSPDINGYTLLFMVPPHLSGLTITQSDPETGGRGVGYESTGQAYESIDPTTLESKLLNICRFATFSAVDFSVPQEQLNTEKISSRSGGIPYATEFTTSEQMSVTYIDDSDLTIYKFHQIWMHYIWDIMEGKLRPSDEYLDPKTELKDVGHNMKGIYHAIDYAGGFYIVKYKPDLKKMTYIGKCIGVFPQSLPSKELIGQRTSNELTTLPFNYFCAAYRAEVLPETEEDLTNARSQKSLKEKYWIYNEFMNLILPQFG